MTVGQSLDITVVYGNNAANSIATGIGLNFSAGACVGVAPSSYDNSNLNGGGGRSMTVNITAQVLGGCSVGTTFSANNASSTSADTGFNVTVVVRSNPVSSGVAATTVATPIPTADTAPTMVIASPEAPPEIAPTKAIVESPSQPAEPIATTAPPQSAVETALPPAEPKQPVGDVVSGGVSAGRGTNWPLVLVGMVLIVLLGGLRWHELSPLE